ncbi:MAG: branched chain amino acid aminotransferase [Chloroflexi bacterium]|nr:branched-chain amino acid transaminase [Chloroflexi bacterium CFX1]MCK6567891.1 branched-chain amino acid transaminase [Anaerolineales bacterium]MCQ3953355.1 branched chain amino acid aminotransferase [Chloroflexota bacterium]MDL1920705.1 branched-chain amino acid transaminase [Chloroflexi bacterium CFX5]RIK52876.1 MAG: branched chain amino acid aminotransferase [Chloroflexota bacterium]
MGMESKFIWMNGELVPFEKATLHFLTPALHYGVGVFEGIRSYNTPKGPAIFRLREHVERLFASAHVLGFRDIPWTVDDIIKATKDTVRANGFTDCYIRPLIYLDGGGWNLNVDGGKPSFGIAVWEWGNYLGAEALANGIRANISSFTRHHVNVSMTKAKIAGNYVNSVLAKTESVRLGFEEAIMLDPQGYVAECTGENLFVVRRGKIITPSTAPVLEGITRHSIFVIAHDLGYQVLEQPVSRDQLYMADEVFVCGTAAEVIGLSEIDYRKIGDGRSGKITGEIQKAFHEAIRGKTAKYEHWCDYVG